VDIGLLSDALERGQGDFEQAAAIIRENVGDTIQQPVGARKARPTSSAARRPNREDAMDYQHEEEDDEMLRHLQDEEDSYMANRYFSVLIW
jgi:hypothetical protein